MVVSDPNRVFISYAHDGPDHIESVKVFSDSLIDPGGISCWIDRYAEGADLPEGWPHWMRTQITEAKYVLVACSPRYQDRLNKIEKEQDRGHGVKFESTLILNEFYYGGSLTAKFIPVIFSKGHEKYIPDFLQQFTHYRLYEDAGREALYRRLTNQPLIVRPTQSPTIINLSASAKPLILEKIITVEKLPEIKELTDMQPGTKVLQAFFNLPMTSRFRIATELGLVESGESFNSSNIDKLSSIFLQRAVANNKLVDLWNKLFDEKIDPNPFKTSSKK